MTETVQSPVIIISGTDDGKTIWLYQEVPQYRHACYTTVNDVQPVLLFKEMKAWDMQISHEPFEVIAGQLESAGYKHIDHKAQILYERVLYSTLIKQFLESKGR